MPNPWFTEPADFVVGGLAKAEDINSLKDAIASAFDLLSGETTATFVKYAQGNISGAVTFNLANGAWITATVTGNVTSMTISGETAGSTVAQGIILELTNGGAYTITWATEIDWAGGAAPSLTAAGKDFIALWTSDNGTTWHGAVVSLDSK